MWKDLSKNSIGKEDWIVESGNVLEEVFDTIAHTGKGDMFYGRGYGTSLENLLFTLNNDELYSKTIRILSKFKEMDGRLPFDLNATQVFINPYETRELDIETTTQGGITVNTRIRG